MLRFEGQSSSTTGGGGAVAKENNSSRKRRQISSSEDESEPIENNLDKRREQEEEEEQQRQQLLPIYEDYQQLAETTAKTAEFIQSLDNRFARLEEGQQQIARYFESNQLPTAAAATATPTARKTLASKSTEFDSLTATAATAANGNKRPKTKKQIKEAAQFKVQELLRLLTD